jgi:hypothetical protein
VVHKHAAEGVEAPRFMAIMHMPIILVEPNIFEVIYQFLILGRDITTF